MSITLFHEAVEDVRLTALQRCRLHALLRCESLSEDSREGICVVLCLSRQSGTLAEVAEKTGKQLRISPRVVLDWRARFIRESCWFVPEQPQEKSRAHTQRPVARRIKSVSPKAAAFVLSHEERALLEQASAASTAADLHTRDVAMRARVVLACADLGGTSKVVRATGVSKPSVVRWRERFVQGRLAAVFEPRAKRPDALRPEIRGDILRFALLPPPEGSRRWTLRQLAQTTGVSAVTVMSILRAAGIELKAVPGRGRGVLVGLGSGCESADANSAPDDRSDQWASSRQQRNMSGRAAPDAGQPNPGPRCQPPPALAP